MIKVNASQYRELHARNTSYGTRGGRLFPYLKPLVEDLRARRLLDYGCGKGTLGRRFVADGYDVTLYDPFVDEHAAPPAGTFDAVLCTDVLEHVPEPELLPLLREIRSYSAHAVFVVSVTFADAILPNGDNAHCTLHPVAWWKDRLRETFGVVEEVPTLRPTAHCLVTWAPGPATVRSLIALRQSRILKEEVVARATAPFRVIGASLRKWASEDELFEQLRGKRVAIIGNALGLTRQSHGAEIDAHDIVLRLNRSPIMSMVSHGTRTDWVATSKTISSGMLSSRNVDYVIWATPDRARIPGWAFRRGKMHLLCHARARALRDAIGARPSAGAYAIDLITAAPCAQISIYGFDGMRTRSLVSFRDPGSIPHDFGREQAWIARLVKDDPRIAFHPVDTAT